jgi:hypothetical protein
MNNFCVKRQVPRVILTASSVYLPEEELVAALRVRIALPVHVSVAEVAEEPGAHQFGHLADQAPDVESLHFGAVLFVALPLQLFLVHLADLALRGEALLGHPRAQHRLDEAEELLDVGLHGGAGDVRLQVGVGAHLEEEVVAEVHGLVPAALGHQRLLRGGLPVTYPTALVRAGRVRLHHRFYSSDKICANITVLIWTWCFQSTTMKALFLHCTSNND